MSMLRAQAYKARSGRILFFLGENPIFMGFNSFLFLFTNDCFLAYLGSHPNRQNLLLYFWVVQFHESCGRHSIFCLNLVWGSGGESKCKKEKQLTCWVLMTCQYRKNAIMQLLSISQ